MPAELEFLGPAQLRQVAAEQHEVGLRIERVDVLDRFDRAFDEALVERARVQMRVGDIREGERRLPGAPVALAFLSSAALATSTS